MVVVVFRSRLKPGVETDMASEGLRMYELAAGMPGFLGYKEYQAEDGEYVAIVEFASHANLAAWRDHPEHKAMQSRGREEWFAEYRIQVCDVVRDYDFSAD